MVIAASSEMWQRLWRSARMWKIHNFQTLSTYLSASGQVYLSQRMLRSTTKELLILPPYKTVLGSHHFSVGAPTIWNKLPTTLRSVDDFKTFETGLKAHLFHHFIDWITRHRLRLWPRLNLALYEIFYYITLHFDGRAAATLTSYKKHDEMHAQNCSSLIKHCTLHGQCAVSTMHGLGPKEYVAPKNNFLFAQNQRFCPKFRP